MQDDYCCSPCVAIEVAASSKTHFSNVLLPLCSTFIEVTVGSGTILFTSDPRELHCDVHISRELPHITLLQRKSAAYIIFLRRLIANAAEIALRMAKKGKRSLEQMASATREAKKQKHDHDLLPGETGVNTSAKKETLKQELKLTSASKDEQSTGDDSSKIEAQTGAPRVKGEIKDKFTTTLSAATLQQIARAALDLLEAQERGQEAKPEVDPKVVPKDGRLTVPTSCTVDAQSGEARAKEGVNYDKFTDTMRASLDLRKVEEDEQEAKQKIELKRDKSVATTSIPTEAGKELDQATAIQDGDEQAVAASPATEKQSGGTQLPLRGIDMRWGVGPGKLHKDFSQSTYCMLHQSLMNSEYPLSQDLLSERPVAHTVCLNELLD